MEQLLLKIGSVCDGLQGVSLSQKHDENETLEVIFCEMVTAHRQTTTNGGVYALPQTHSGAILQLGCLKHLYLAVL